MSKRPSTKLPSNSPQRHVPKKLYTILGPPAVSADQHAAFDELWGLFRDSLQPKNFIDEMLLRNIADLEMEVRTLRKLKSALMTSSQDDGLITLLDKLGLDFSHRKKLSEAWIRREPEAIKQVEALLKKAQMGSDEILAHTLANRIDAFEKLDRMTAQAEARRNNHINELMRHKASWAEPIKAITEAPIDVEFHPASGDGNEKDHSS